MSETREEILNDACKKIREFTKNQKPIPPEIQKTVNDNFWDLI